MTFLYVLGHDDSGKACSSASQFVNTKCKDLKLTVADGYKYGCNTTNFEKGYTALCETGDTSGKFGMAMNLDHDQFYQKDALVDYNGPKVANYYVELDPVAKAWRSYVMHCGDAAKTRFVCANFKRVGPNECASCEFPGFYTTPKNSPKTRLKIKSNEQWS
jgi:hypothetical protein